MMVTMAPEVDGATDVARFFFDQGIVCSAGHTSAHYREGMLAIGLGFRTLTHAFNAMPPLDHRDPSILAAFIQESRTTVQLICDGYHVSPAMVDLLYRTLHDRIVLTTDNMPPAGAGIASKAASCARKTARSRAARCAWIKPCATNGLHGPPVRARAILCATSAPAKLLGMQRELGLIAPGLRADLSFWDSEYSVIGAMVGGVTVFGELGALAAA